jgi:hypothetical protein
METSCKQAGKKKKKPTMVNVCGVDDQDQLSERGPG